METKKSKLEIFRCNNGFLLKTKPEDLFLKTGPTCLHKWEKNLKKWNRAEKY